MDDKNADTDIVSDSMEGSNLVEKPVESMIQKEKGSPIKKEHDESHGVDETVEGKNCDQIENSEVKEDASVQNVLVEGNDQTEVVWDEIPEQVTVNKDTVEKYDEPKEVDAKEVVEPESEKNEVVEQNNESKEVVPQEVVEQEIENNEVAEQENESKEAVPKEVANHEDKNKPTVGEDNGIKELGASENIVGAATEEETPKKEMSDVNVISGEMKESGEDDQTKVAKHVNEKKTEDNNEVKEGKENNGVVDGEKMEVEQEYKADASENKSVEVEINPKEMDVDVKDRSETEQLEGKLEGFSIEKDNKEENSGPKKRKRKGNAANKTKGEEKDEEGQTTPIIPVSTRPVRERKSVERLVASIEKEAIRGIFVEKGPGVALKDIPNVAYKLSKKKNDETFKQLHTILFGRRGKAIQMKSHVSQFSGFVWHDNEEKNKMKVKEKFEKLVKEKLIDFCDVLDIPIANKVSTKKEEVVTKIMDFLASPHPTTVELLQEKEHSGKTTKRKRSGGLGSPTIRSAKISRKRRRKASEKSNDSGKSESDSDGESDKEEDEVVTENQGNGNSKLNQSEGESSEKKSSESEDAMDEDVKHRRQRSKKNSVKANSSSKKRSKSKTPEKLDLNGSEESDKVDAKNHKQNPTKSSGKIRSTKKAQSSNSKDEKKKQIKSVLEKEPNIRAKNGNSSQADPKGKPKEERLKPSDKVLRNQICHILKEVDFNTATFTDILKMLGKHFKTDLTPRKACIKLIIQEELTKLADAADDDEDEKQDVTPEPAKINA